MDEQEQKVSKYSSGINIILRLNTLWIDTHLHSRQGLYMLWNADLDRIWLELVRDFKEDDYKKQKKKFDEYDGNLKKQMPFSDEKPAGFKKVDDDMINKRNEIYTILMNKQLFLARLENELGKGTTFDDDDEHDFD